MLANYMPKTQLTTSKSDGVEVELPVEHSYYYYYFSNDYCYALLSFLGWIPALQMTRDFHQKLLISWLCTIALKRQDLLDGWNHSPLIC